MPDQVKFLGGNEILNRFLHSKIYARIQDQVQIHGKVVFIFVIKPESWAQCF